MAGSFVQLSDLMSLADKKMSGNIEPITVQATLTVNSGNLQFSHF